MEMSNQGTPQDLSNVTPTQPTYVGFDLETTGVDYFTDLPVSYAFVEHIVPGRELYEDVIQSGYVNPGVPIPAAVTAIHGITDAMVADAPQVEWATEMIAARLDSVWKNGGVIVGMNVSFDITMVDSLCQRFGLVPLSQRGLGPIIDVLVIDRHYDKYRRGGRKLTDLCKHYGVVLGDAHDAASDSSACLEILQIQLAAKPELAAIPLDKINESVGPWYETWARDYSAYRVKNGDSALNEGRFSWPVHTDD
jgi:DNA polymerase-3 subunit epsilon